MSSNNRYCRNYALIDVRRWSPGMTIEFQKLELKDLDMSSSILVGPVLLISLLVAGLLNI
jgi:hypothetical protein